MKGSAGSPGFQPGAVGVGMLWGLGLMLLGVVVQGVVNMGTPLSEGVLRLMDTLWPAVGAAVGGYLAGRRAAGVGWLHGLLAGIALVLSLAAVMGISSALPTLAWALKVGGVSAGAGMLGGVLGVNSAR